jgi:hypothetical protein
VNVPDALTDVQQILYNAELTEVFLTNDQISEVSTLTVFHEDDVNIVRAPRPFLQMQELILVLND